MDTYAHTIVCPLTAVLAGRLLNTGNVMGYFYGSSAGHTDYVGMLNLTISVFSGWQFNNQTTVPGTSIEFGPVTAGDVLVFQL
ncbi:MAG TPA: hypothetical protein VMT56_03200 [Candidatus Bathyarchaeia archaeon]|nr:hypothetical protein [Candidatus Bathyarchaeia archaeon]